MTKTVVRQHSPGKMLFFCTAASILSGTSAVLSTSSRKQ